MRILIKNGFVLDPVTAKCGINDIMIENDRIVDVEKDLSTVPNERCIDASGCCVMPGFIDMHVHLREPGYEYKETVVTGSMAAAAGGYTTIAAMPNTKPVIDTPERVEDLLRIIRKDARVHVLPIGAVTIGQDGRELTDITGMKASGIYGISEDGKSVMNIDLYRAAMLQAKVAELPVMAHCEDKDLLHGGVVNDNAAAKRLGLPGISNTVEDHIAIRDILLAHELGCRLHLCHCSTALSVEFVRLAKRMGARVTAEVCPHHFALTEDDIPGDDANYKMNPPLRSKADVDALIAGLQDGTIDVIATDHAPHSREEKAKSMLEAPFGIVGLETAYSIAVTRLVRTGILTPLQLVEKMSYRPAKILGLVHKDGRGTLAPGAIADLVITDPEEKWIVNPEAFKSKGRNTPFGGEFVYGRVKMTMVAGHFIYEESEERK